jgi:hypothetical protein
MRLWIAGQGDRAFWEGDYRQERRPGISLTVLAVASHHSDGLCLAEISDTPAEATARDLWHNFLPDICGDDVTR